MKHSIRKQFMLVFSAVMVGVILACLIANNMLLAPFYIKQKQSVLADAYHMINNYAQRDAFSSEEFEVDFDSTASKYNIEIIIMGPDTKAVRSSVNNPEPLIKSLLRYLFVGIAEENILIRNSNYVIQKTIDPRIHYEYIELWGTLSDSQLIFMRTPVESIKSNVRIANRFMTYVALIVLLAGLIINYYMSRKVARPILELVDISEKMSNLDFDVKFKSKTNNEISLLGNNINQMSENLERTISELKSANIELKRDLDKKIEMDEMRKEFLSHVSHELKTPIALIQGYSEGLMDCVNSDEESRKYYCEVIVDEAGKMNTLVKNLLELNQLEFGKDNLELERLDIVEMLNGFIKSSSIILKQNGISLVFEHDEESMFVWADAYKLEQVINNYLSNAVHYCAGEKQLRVSAVRRDDKVRVCVFNTGDAIPEEALAHLWNKFYKVDKARTREYGGSGIGLSIVKAVMDAHGQAYGVENHDDGVEFWFELDGR